MGNICDVKIRKEKGFGAQKADKKVKKGKTKGYHEISTDHASEGLHSNACIDHHLFNNGCRGDENKDDSTKDKNKGYEIRGVNEVYPLKNYSRDSETGRDDFSFFRVFTVKNG